MCDSLLILSSGNIQRGGFPGSINPPVTAVELSISSRQSAPAAVQRRSIVPLLTVFDAVSDIAHPAEQFFRSG